MSDIHAENKKMCFILFVLKEYFVKQSYPIDIINIMMIPLIKSPDMLTITIDEIKLLKSYFRLINELSNNCYVEISNSQMKIYASDEINSLEINLNNDFFYLTDCQYPKFLMKINSHDFLNKINKIDDSHTMLLYVEINCPNIIYISSYLFSLSKVITSFESSDESSNYLYKVEDNETIDIFHGYVHAQHEIFTTFEFPQYGKFDYVKRIQYDAFKQIYENTIEELVNRFYLNDTTKKKYTIIKQISVKTFDVINKCYDIHDEICFYVKDDIILIALDLIENDIIDGDIDDGDIDDELCIGELRLFIKLIF